MNERYWHCDLHIHTQFSKDSLMEPNLILKTAVKRGINCLAITDHNEIEGAYRVKLYSKNYNIRVIVGEEIKTSEGEIIGYFLNKKVPQGLSPEETVAKIKKQGALVAIPHPFDRLRKSKLKMSALLRVLPYVDIIEVFNGRTHYLDDNKRALNFAKKTKKLISAGSDSHTSLEIGSTFVRMPPFDSIDTFKQSLCQGRITGRKNPDYVHIFSTFIKIYKSFHFVKQS